MCSLGTLASVKVSHWTRHLLFCLPNTLEWSTGEQAPTRPWTRGRGRSMDTHVKGARQQCGGARRLSALRLTTFVCVIRKYSLGSQEQRRKRELSHLMLFSLHLFLFFLLFCCAAFILPFHLSSFVSALPRLPCFAE